MYNVSKWTLKRLGVLVLFPIDKLNISDVLEKKALSDDWDCITGYRIDKNDISKKFKCNWCQKEGANVLVLVKNPLQKMRIHFFCENHPASLRDMVTARYEELLSLLQKLDSVLVLKQTEKSEALRGEELNTFHLQLSNEDEDRKCSICESPNSNVLCVYNNIVSQGWPHQRKYAKIFFVCEEHAGQISLIDTP